MIHRYNGHNKHRNNTYTWKCTCGADGAVQYRGLHRAQLDHLAHQQHTITTEDASWCDWCTASTTEPFLHPDGGGNLCYDCYESALPRAELLATDF